MLCRGDVSPQVDALLIPRALKMGLLHPPAPWQVAPGAAGSEEPITVAHIVVEAAALAGDINHSPDIVGKPVWPHCGCPLTAFSALTQ